MQSDASIPGLIPLRDYQRKAVDAVHDAARRGLRRPLCAMATGLGKSLCAGYVVKERPGRAVVLAHRDELLRQLGRAVQMADPGARIGFVKAAEDEVDADIVIASIQTLARPARLQRLIGSQQHRPMGQGGLFDVGHVSPRADRRFTTVICDEGHHFLGADEENTFGAVLRGLGAFEQDGPLVVGWTATPERGDGKALGSVFEEIVFEMGILAGMGAGYLCDVRAKQVKLAADFSKLKTRGGDFRDEETAEMLMAADAPKHAAAAYLREAKGRKALCFVPTVAVAEAMTQAFRGVGVPAETAHGGLDPVERAAILRRFKTGETLVCPNAQILTEGFDEPSVDCIIMARPTRSRPFAIQMVGRGTRIFPGKTDCIAEGQRVLTNRGLVPIENVTASMKVWDGIEFVSHDGAVYKGEQEVIEYAGLIATPDHKVWTEEGWRAFSDCSRDLRGIAITGDGWRTVRQIAGRYRRNSDPWVEEIYPRRVCRMRLKRVARSCGASHRTGRLSRVRKPATRTEMARSAHERRKAPLRESKGYPLQQVRRSRHSIQFREPTRYGAVGPRTLGPQETPATRPDRQRRALRARKYSLPYESTKLLQHAPAKVDPGYARVSCAAPGNKVRGLDSNHAVRSRPNGRGDCGAVLPVLMQAKRRVWDILNSGPRHRFTVEGLLVSNCLILDLVGSVSRMDLVTVASLFEVSAEAAEGGVIAAVQAKRAKEEREGVTPAADDAPEGRLVSVDVAMFHKRDFSWVPAGGRFVLSLGAEGNLVLQPGVEADSWDIVRQTREQKQYSNWKQTAERKTHAGLPLETAQSLCEEIVRQAGTAVLNSKDAAWRQAPATEAQIKALKKRYVPGMTKGQASEALSAMFVSRGARR